MNSRSFSRILAVACKEVVDTFRDRRTMMVTLLSAAVAGPIFIVLIFNMIAGQADPEEFAQFEATAVSNPSKSWNHGGKKNPGLLDHEQGHFDITQIHALRLCLFHRRRLHQFLHPTYQC